jgi:hypothetical protein
LEALKQKIDQTIKEKKKWPNYGKFKRFPTPNLSTILLLFSIVSLNNVCLY